MQNDAHGFDTEVAFIDKRGEEHPIFSYTIPVCDDKDTNDITDK